MSTEASYRFERGTDVFAMPEAVRRAVGLIIAVAGGKEEQTPIDVHPRSRQLQTVFLRLPRVEHLLGAAIPRGDIESFLSRLGFSVAPKGGERLAVQIPGWRPDVSREADLIEEIARVRGYDSFEARLSPFRPSTVPDDPVERVMDQCRRLLIGYGLNEARSLSLGPASTDEAVAVLRPLSADESYLRTDLMTGLLKAVEHNWSKRERNVRLFEIGRVFRRVDGGAPQETIRIGVVISGSSRPDHWSTAGTTPDYDVWDLKFVFETTVRACGPEGATVVAERDRLLLRHPKAGVLGWARQLDVTGPPWSGSVLGFELPLATREADGISFRPLAEHPPVERDLALIVPEGTVANRVEEVIRAKAGAYLESLHVFDEYRANEIGGRSVAWRLVFRAPERTLRDSEVDGQVTRILKALEEQLGVKRREG